MSDLSGIIEKFRDTRVLVMGDMMLDTYLIGRAERISPEAPVPVVRLDKREERLGGAANCAMNIAALGGVPIMMGAVGRREAGERFLSIVHENDFPDEGLLIHDHFLTTRKVRVIADSQQIVRVDEEERLEISESFHKKVCRFLKNIIPTVKAVAVSDYAKGFINAPVMNEMFDIARMNKVPVMIDPKPFNSSLYRGCDLLKPNTKEISEMSGIKVVDDETCDMAANWVMLELSPRALLVTRGPEGMVLYRNMSDPVRIKSNVSYVYDVSGAGDTVLATLAVSAANEVDLVDSCRLASIAAGIAVRKPTTSTVSPDELRQALENVPVGN